MNGVHDMGGQQGFGPVRPEAHEPVFHAEWEKRALALTVAMGATGQWHIDLSRSARESLPPATYLGSSYYAIWTRALQQQLLERDLVSADELRTGQLQLAGQPLTRVLRAANVDAVLARGAPSDQPATTPARFALGGRVRARNIHPSGHTRLPRYVRGHVGVVERVHGVHLFPDRHVSTPTPPFCMDAEWLYTVAFDARTLWGPDADAALRVSVDAWESYLDSADATP